MQHFFDRIEAAIKSIEAEAHLAPADSTEGEAPSDAEAYSMVYASSCRDLTDHEVHRFARWTLARKQARDEADAKAALLAELFPPSNVVPFRR